MKKPYILVAPNGARRGLIDHPQLPLTIDEIVFTGVACHLAGARGLHLHVRDDAGRHSLDAGRYLETLAAINAEVPSMEVQITTESAGLYGVDDQMNCLKEVQPDWASISVREIARDPDAADSVYGLCEDQGTRVQHILYNAEDVSLLAHWQSKGVVRPTQIERLCVLGRYADGQKSTPEDLKPFLENGPRNTPWMVCAFGPSEHHCLLKAAELGADVRVGFENSVAGMTGTPWADNAASVAELVKRIKGLLA